MSENGIELYLRFHGRIIEHLGIQMYQKPVSAVAEIIANAWDADAEHVRVMLPQELEDESEIIIKDDGFGMTLSECQDKYLNAGMCRRGDNPNEVTPKGRPVLGRKGIGKFAGFGIAKVVRVTTVSKLTGESTTFEMSIDELRGDDYVSTTARPVRVIEHRPPDEARREDHGTTVTLRELVLSRKPSESIFLRSMARRFLLHQRVADFEVRVNGQVLPEDESLEKVEYRFPEDYRSEERPPGLSIGDDGWGEETLTSGKVVKWRIRFYSDPIDQEELRGVAVFAKGKLAQEPFFFNLVGGLGGQHGMEYLTGQVQADYIDSLPSDLIATERQRVNLEHDETIPLEQWGQERIKQLLVIWRARRGERRREEIERKLVGFSERLERLPGSERKTVRSALNKLCRISALSNQQFSELGDAILLSWEQGRLRQLIEEIADLEDLTEVDLLQVLVEAQVLTALNTAEAVKTKLLTVGGLKLRIQQKALETAVRDFIAKNPWLISPEWETFRRERTVRKLLADAAEEAGMDGEDWEGRVDLALSSGKHLLVLEFMRPGLSADWDHAGRFKRYIHILRDRVETSTQGKFDRVTGYLVADNLNTDTSLAREIRDMRTRAMYALDWDDVFRGAVSTWEEFLDTLVDRAPEDPRLQALRESVDGES